MSNKLSGYVWDGCAAAGLKLSEVAIMARLADFSSDEGRSWPSIATIARQIGAGESTVRTALAKLEKDGWLTRQQRRAGNRNASNIYLLNVEKLRLAADASDSDTSNSDASKSDPSKSEASKSGQSAGFDPSESGGDPSVNSKQDPSGKDSCQPPVATDPEVVVTDQAKRVLKHLNQITGSKYQPATGTLQNIRARLAEGFIEEELVLVADYTTAKWGDDLKMAEYLRPSTLYQPAKFPGYLTAAGKWHEAGRPACVNGKWVNNGDPAADVDKTLRDKAYQRFIGSSLQVKEPSAIEQQVRAAASKAGVKSMRAEWAQREWNRIWAEQSQQEVRA